MAPPFVCNGCADERICHLPKKYYIAKVAQADRESKLHESRSHEELRRILLKGTSFNSLDQEDVNVVLSNVNCHKASKS